MNRPISAAVAIVADRWLGEPSVEPHPVAAFGEMMTAIEDRIYKDSVLRGAVYVALGIGCGAGFGALLPTALASYIAIAGSMLGRVAADVATRLRDGDVDGARELIPALVGRDPEALDATALARAAIESVAENAVDAVIAPACWAATLGGPGVLGHRALNTMDAMVGHHDERYERFGRTAARLDDLAAWLPARFAAALVVLVRPTRRRAIWRAVRDDAPRHPSPNGGVVEAAFAAALDIRLGGANRYGDRVEDRGVLGDGRAPTVHDVDEAVRLLRDISYAMAGVLAVHAIRRHR